MPIKFSKIWDTQNNCYVYTLKKDGDKGKVGMLKFFDRDNDGLDANDGFTANNSSIFSEEELQKNVLGRYRDYSPTMTTTVNGKEVNLPEVEYSEDETKISIKENKEYNLGTLAKVLRKDYSGNKTQTQNQNRNQYPNQYQSNVNNNSVPFQGQSPKYPGLADFAVKSMSNSNTPNLNWMNAYPLEGPTQETQQPNINFNNLGMFQNKWSNIFSGLMSMGTMGNADMMGSQFQMAALAMMSDTNYLFAPNQMQYGNNPMASNGVNNNPYNGQQQYNYNNQNQDETLATSGALSDNPTTDPSDKKDSVTTKTPSDKKISTDKAEKPEKNLVTKHHAKRHTHHTAHKHVGTAHRKHSKATYSNKHVTVHHYSSNLREILEKFYDGKMTSKETTYANGKHITETFENGKVVSTKTDIIKKSNAKDKGVENKNDTKATDSKKDVKPTEAPATEKLKTIIKNPAEAENNFA